MKKLLLTLALLALAALFQSHYRFTIVLGQSMEPTLKSGDILLIDKRAYNHSDPSRGDLIVARHDDDLIVKRLVGLPSEELEVRNGRLYVDGQLTHEDYPIAPGLLSIEKGTLLQGDYATLGDNRSIPASLAVHPIITKPDILGKVVLTLRLSFPLPAFFSRV